MECKKKEMEKIEWLYGGREARFYAASTSTNPTARRLRSNGGVFKIRHNFLR